MTRLRHSRLVKRIALFALALQFGLLIGHAHHDRKAHPHAPFPVVVCQSDSNHTCQPPAHDDDDKDHGPCGLCFALAMLETAATSAPAALIRDFDLSGSRLPILVDDVQHVKTAVSFRARAPPRAG